MKIPIFLNNVAARRHHQFARAAAPAPGDTVIILCFVHSIFHMTSRYDTRQAAAIGAW